MATKDIVLLNQTSSKLEAQQSTDTARIRGNSDLLLSVEDASYNQILTVNTNTSEIGTPAITASGEISMSATGSFGRVNATYFRGDGSNLTYALTADHVSSSVQLSANISGSWQGDLSQSEFTYPEYLAGEESGLTFVSGGLTGSVSSTASFGRIETDKVTGDGSQMTNWIPNLTISSSTQIAKSISGSWQNSFSSSNQLNISGGISSSSPHHQFSSSFWGPDGCGNNRMVGVLNFKSSGSNHPLSASTSWTIGGWFRSTYGETGYGINGREILFKIGEFNGWIQGAGGQNAFIVGANFVPEGGGTYWSALGLGEDTLGAGPNSTLRNQEWHHLTFTANGTTGSVFLDGQVISQSSIVGGASGLNTGAYASTMSINADPVIVNVGTGWTAYPFGGALGTWAVWSEALSGSAAPYLFNDYQGAELDTNDSSRGYTQAHALEGWWKIGESSSFGETIPNRWSVADSSGNNMTGSSPTANKPGPTAITSSGYGHRDGEYYAGGYGYKAVPVVKSSFDNITANTFTGDGSGLTSVIHKGVISSSDAFAERTIMGMRTGSGVNLISGSWQNELSSSSDLFVSGGISGSTLSPQFSSSFYLASGVSLDDYPRINFDQSGSHHVWPLSASSTWTVGGWYKADPGLNTSGRVAVWRMGTQTGNQHIWLTRNNGSADGHYLTVTTGDGAGGDQVLSFTSQSGERGDPNSTTNNRIKKVEDGQWHQFFISAEQSTGSLFLDGEFITSSLITSKYNIGGGTTMSLSGDDMGISPAHWYWTPQGNHGTWACWNHALSASSAEVLYNQGLSKDFTVNERGYQQASDLVGWWKIGESSSFGETVANRWEFADSSGNNFTGSSTVGDSDVNAISSSGVLDAPRFTSTVGRIEATSITGDGTFYRGRGRSQGLMNVLDLGIISSSTVIAPEVTGSWQGEFSSSAQLFISGGISSSAASGEYSSYAFEHSQGANDFWNGGPGGAGSYWDFSDEGNQVSFGVWFTMDDIPSDRKAYILDAGDVFLRINDTNDAWRAGAGGISGVYQYNLDEALTRYKWHHVFVTYDKAKVKIYTDGKETATGNATGNTVMSKFNIGANNTWDGKMADFLVYNKGITAEAVSQLYNNGMGGNPLEISQSALKAWYKMGEGSTFVGSTWYQPDALGLAPTITSSLTLGAAARVEGRPAGGSRFSRVDANTLSGDGSQLKGIFTQGELSSSAQIAQDITGSTHWGHTLTSSLDTKVGQLDQNVSAVGSPVFSDVIVSGSVKAAKMIMTSSVSHYSSSKGSGSVAFGDSTGDLHSFTGSLQVGGIKSVWRNKYMFELSQSVSPTDAGMYLHGGESTSGQEWNFGSGDWTVVSIIQGRDEDPAILHNRKVWGWHSSQPRIDLWGRTGAMGWLDIYPTGTSRVNLYFHTFQAKQWYHVAASRRGNDLIASVDYSGSISSSTYPDAFTESSTFDMSGDNFFVSNQQRAALTYTAGMNINDIKVWKGVALSHQDQFRLMKSWGGDVPHPDQLVSWWNMGDTAYYLTGSKDVGHNGDGYFVQQDTSGHGNHLTSSNQVDSGIYNPFPETSRSLGPHSGSSIEQWGDQSLTPLLIPQGHVKGENFEHIGDRGVTFAGSPRTNIIDYVTISTPGNATDFGDLTEPVMKSAATSNGANDRAVINLGYNNSNQVVNALEYITVTTTGNSTDFGDMTVPRFAAHFVSNGPNERGVIGGCDNPGHLVAKNTLDYITISTTGDASSFGSLPDYRWGASSLSNGVNDRGIIAGGSPVPTAAINQIDYITISALGDSSDFGDLVAANFYQAGLSSDIEERGIIAGYTDSIDFITISSPGNAADFGDVIGTPSWPAGFSSGVNQRGIIAGGDPTNIIQYITISSPGNATDFGDLTRAAESFTGTSNAAINNLSTGSFAEWTGDGSGLTFSSNPTSASFSDPLRAFRAHGSADPVFGGNANSGFGAATGSLIIPSGITGNASGASGSRFSNQGRVSYQGGSTLLRHNIQAENTAFDAHFSSASAAQWRSGSISASYAAETLESGSAHMTGSSAGPAPQHGSLTHQFVEAWDGLNWIVFATGSAQVGQRGVIITSDTVEDIEYITISNQGNAANFGNQTNASKSKRSATSNGTNGRGLFGGGAAPGNISVIDYVTISTPSDATAFGDLSVARGTLGAISNGTNDRAVFGGGTDRMDYVTISTLGNAAIFGTLQALTIGTEGTSNGTDERGIFGGTYPAANATIEFITIFNVSDAADFGDLVVAAGTRASFSNDLNQRGIFAGGTAPAAKADIDYVTISTVGNASDFGDLTEVNAAPGGLSSGTNDRGVVFGDSPVQKTIQYITISTPGNATDFGRLREAKADAKGTSNSAK